MQSPLIDVIMNYAADTAGIPLDREKEQILHDIFLKYINRYIDPNELINQTISICSSSAPAEKLISILKTEKEKPIEPPLKNKISLQSRRQTRSWSSNEDNRLLMGIHKYGKDNWNKVALFVGNGRSRSQCSQRWIRVLDPKISKNHWTEKEENMLIELVQKFGNKNWMKISGCLGNRSDVQCRYRYKRILQRHPQLANDEDLSPTSSSVELSPKSSMTNNNDSNAQNSDSNAQITAENSNLSDTNSLKNPSLKNDKQEIENEQKDQNKNNDNKKDETVDAFFKNLFDENEDQLIKDQQCDDMFSCFI